jgi:GNAT superfamily N-acetyltransferase
MRSEAPVIRAAALDDMPACAAIFNHWVDETGWMPRVHDHEDVVRHYRESVYADNEVIVAESGGAVAAFLALSRDGFVTALYIDRPHRRRGFGKLLLDRAKERHPGGLRLWTFAANAEAQRFYRREGFIEERRTAGDNEEGLPDILLRWPGRGTP